MSAAYLRRHRVTVPTQLRAYTPDEAAAETGLTLDELRRMRERGEGPAYVTIGKRTVRYIRLDVDEWKSGGLVAGPRYDGGHDHDAARAR